MMTLSDLPTLNAGLNAWAGLLLLCGYVSIRMKWRKVHRAFMIAAFLVSSAFLVSYLVYHFFHPVNPYLGTGYLRYVYYTVLFTHIPLAAALVPLALLALYHAYRERFGRHVRIARIALPIWLYVSVTGVVVYLMLYQF